MARVIAWLDGLIFCAFGVLIVLFLFSCAERLYAVSRRTFWAVIASGYGIAAYFLGCALMGVKAW